MSFSRTVEVTTSCAKATSTNVGISVPSQIDRLDKHGYLFGQKIAASLSPFLHDIIYNELGLKWEQFRLDSADLDHFLQLIRHPNFYGASVTMPNKVAILPHLDDMTQECRDVGACNTIFIRDDPATSTRKLCGTNTDVIGVRESFFQNVDSPSIWEGRPGLVIGGGGAARSAVYALRKWLGVTDIYLVNRDEVEIREVIDECTQKGFGEGLVHVKTIEQAENLQGPGAIVACIPDFPPVTEEEKLARRLCGVMLRKERKGAILEMCYNPSPYTALGAMAEKEGWQVILGTEAMIWQGLEQDKYWTGRDIIELPVKQVQEAIAERLAKHSTS